MNTDELIRRLAADAAPAPRHAFVRRHGRGMLLGAGGSVLLMALLFGIRPDLHELAATPLFWAKLAFPFATAAAAWPLVLRLSRPGAALGWRVWLVAVPVAIVWLAAANALLQAAPAQRLELVLGSTWRECPFNIALLSLPGFVGACWAIKGLAPTHLRAAGAAAGLLAGATAALAYSLHCPETSVAFWAVWYLLGMLLPALLGALLYVPLFRDFFHLASPTIAQLGVACVIGLASVAWFEVYKWIKRRSNEGR